MVKWKIIFTKQAQRDSKKLKSAGLKEKAQKILDLLENNPHPNPPHYEKLIGDLSGSYSRRINLQLRLVYQILQDIKTVKIISMWTHYE